MKKILTITLILALVFTAAIVAYGDEMPIRSVGDILTEIQEEQGVDSTDLIDPDDVDLAVLEELGDSVMEAMIGNSEMHEQMDERLGGEGSDSLTAFHTRLGYNYLVGFPNGMMSLMTAGMMGSNLIDDGDFNWGGMMGSNNYRGYGLFGGMMGSLGWIGILMGFIIFVLFLILLFFIMKAFVKKPGATTLESPLDILKKRYAAGEITHEDYEKMSEHLRK